MPRLLLHVCCGPCSIATVRMLREEGFEVTGLFINPNIHPSQEYLRRREAMQETAARLELPMIWRDDAYDMKAWLRHMAWREDPRTRCRICYATRLEPTLTVARRGGFDAFSTSLLYSRRQQHETIAEVGAGLAGDGSVSFVYRDFRTGWQEGIDTSKAWGIYRQTWCGCIFSENERYAADFSRATGRRAGGPRGEGDSRGDARKTGMDTAGPAARASNPPAAPEADDAPDGTAKPGTAGPLKGPHPQTGH